MGLNVLIVFLSHSHFFSIVYITVLELTIHRKKNEVEGAKYLAV